MIRLVLLAFWFTSFAYAMPTSVDGVVDAEILDVREFNTIRCDCNIPTYMGKVCIASTQWSWPKDSLTPQDPAPSTGFEAHVENEIFKLTSTAYYMSCYFGETPIVFTDPELQKQFAGQKYLDYIGVLGTDAFMRVGIENAYGEKRYFSLVRGSFAEQRFYSNKGEPTEFYRPQYVATVVFEKPLGDILTDFQIRRILDGEDLIKIFKATLFIRLQSGKDLGFGEYTLRIRFFRKPGAKPKHLWDTSVIGIQVQNT